MYVRGGERHDDAGWYLSGRIIDELEADRDAVMGLTWDGGYGQVRPAVSFDGPTEVRELTVLDGAHPPTVAAAVDVARDDGATDVVLAGASLGTGRVMTSLRTGLDFDTVDYVDRAGDLTAPMLVFHGTADTTIPFEIGESFAAARPDLVEFHPVEGGGHVRAWNEDPEAYATHVRGFLERIAGDRP